MRPTETTCWTVIQGAAAGSAGAREAFARQYLPVVRAYLGARWRNSWAADDIEDAAQEVFAECFRQGGPLDRAERTRPGGFRPFLYGIVRNVAQRFERRRAIDRAHRPDDDMDLAQVEADETSLTQLFDREWARTILREAAERQAERARQAGADARRRIELLQLRFQQGLPIREIAKRWKVDAPKVHREYAKAREEFKTALLEVVVFHHPGASAAEVERECAELLRAIG